MSYEREHIDLFTGLAGFSLAAQANGVRTIAQCEADTFLAAGLLRAWGVDVWPDVRHFPGEKYSGAWLLSAGVPCQPASRAGDQRGETDDRWLWPEAIRVTEAVQPHWAIFENPPGIDDVGLGGILSELGGLGYEIGVCRVPACAVNSPQDRDRFWIVGHRTGNRGQARGANTARGQEGQATQHDHATQNGALANGTDAGHPIGSPQPEHKGDDRATTKRADEGGALAGSARGGQPVCGGAPGKRGLGLQQNENSHLASPPGTRPAPGLCAASARVGWRRFCNVLGSWSDFQWVEVPRGRDGIEVCRAPTRLYGMAHGLPSRLPRGVGSKLISALGNAIVWPVAAELIGAMIKAEENL